ncbi:Suppressor of Sensor Kinase (SLN1) [Coemansia brasiliensis]|uniref:Suppressor of Sensor Kinase (SLN1) n=1 Tax=Coemansia brasiliensis TaxID=2650707 RepID=A0A9W8I9Y7_9FUNG|nr:Suppressor of Sensor Kinase (SLN1) [Coemansia brasiliensis]
MDTENEDPTELRSKLVYLYRYPTSSSELEAHEIDKADARGEELRRRLQAQGKLTALLKQVGARVTTEKSDCAAAAMVVIPDNCSAEHRSDALALGIPVVSESALLQHIQLLSQGSNEHNDTLETPQSIEEIPAQLRNSVCLDEVDANKYSENDSKSNAAEASDGSTALPAKVANADGNGSQVSDVKGAKRHHNVHRILDPTAMGTASISIEPEPMPTLLKAPKRTSELTSEGRSDSNSDDIIEGPVLLTDEERRERTEWHQMLTSALCSQVVDGEKKRLKAQAESYLFNLSDSEYAKRLEEMLQMQEGKLLRRHAHIDLWLGCRAAIRGRTPLQEKQTLESLRNHHVDTTLRGVMEFSADTVVANIAGDESAPESDFSAQCLAQLQKLLRRLDYVEGMYPTLHALGEAKPSYTSQLFQEKLSAITSWTNISVRIELLYKMIQRWTGSRELNLFATDSTGIYSSTTAGITRETEHADNTTCPETEGSSRSSSLDAVKKRVQHTPFVERLLKENGMKMIFEQKILTELDQAMISARSDMIENSDMIIKMGLPITNRRMQDLLLFPPRLLQTCLQIRLQSAENLVNLPQVQVDQLIEDIRDSLSVACRVKRTFIQLAKPTEKWNPEVQLDSEYDTTLRSCLHTYFRLVHRKLVIVKGSAIGVRDFEILENQWPFLLEIVRDIDGGHYELVRRYCQQVRRSMRLWIRILAQKLEGPEGYDSIDSRNLGRWITKTLQDIRAPILKAQRLVRTLQNALTNATDYTFDDPLLLLAELVNTKHGLIYTGGEWESHGVYIICSKALLDNPHLAKEMLSACIVDDVMKSESFKNCYLLIVRTDAEFNWTGSTVRPEGGTIAYQELELSPGQMRLVAPGLDRLERYRHWMERLNIAQERQPWQTYTGVTDEILHDFLSPSGKYHIRRHSSAVTNSQADSANNDGHTHEVYQTGLRYNGNEGTPSETSGYSQRGGLATSIVDNIDDEDMDRSHLLALRPSLEPYDRQLGVINSPEWEGAARGGVIEDMGRRRNRSKSKQAAVAQVYELNRAHNPHIQREWTLLKFSITRMLEALTQLPDMLRTLHLDYHERGFYEARSRQSSENPQSGRHTDVVCQGANCDLLEQVQEAFSFVSNTSSRGARFLDLKAERYIRLGLLHMSVGWCAFIAEDCMANERRTFRWAMQALEFTMSTGKSNTLQVLPREDWQLLKAQVAGCVTLMISHFDVLGNRNEDLNVKDRQKRREMAQLDEPNMLLSLDGIGANFRTHLMQRQRLEHAQQVDALRDQFLSDECRIGRVLEVTALPEDQTLRLLAASSSNITLRWQMGRYIGGGAFGAVYIGYNLDTGELMAVKEIRFPTRPLASAGIQRGADARRSDLGNKIVREMEVMSMLQHPNIVTYYGIEVHREKVYLFMELCSRGSLAQLVKDQGRLDENTTRIFVVQMLRGMQYLHESGICHRDIKCDNTLLDENMHIKLVDFGAAKVLNQHSLAATRRTRAGREGASLTGTPMYMAPEVILGSGQGGTRMAGGGAAEALRPGFLGAQDIWSLGCCVVEMVTGNPPWAHLDNEWAIMYHVVSGDPPLPNSSNISLECLRFIRRCFTRQPSDRPRAADLLTDEWLAPTIRNMERLEARNQAKLGTPIDYMASITQTDSDRGAATPSVPSHRSTLSINAAEMPALVNSNSAANSAVPSPSRSRKSSMHTKNLSGDLRFMNSTASLSNAEVLLSMMNQSLESSSSNRIRAYSGSDRSPAAAESSYMAGRSPGTPGSQNSLHAAWPFNKPASHHTIGSAAVSPAAGRLATSPAISVGSGDAITGTNSASGSSALLAGSPEALNSAEEDLVARYTNPSAIYQAISASANCSNRGSYGSGSQKAHTAPFSRLQHSSEMGSSDTSESSVDSASVSQFATGIASYHAGDASRVDSANDPNASRSQSMPVDTNQNRQGQLSSNDIHELTETTRRAVTALLNFPLEGADVSGVSGWLGEGNTAVELLNADEIKETVATTSHNIVRQHEQQLRQKQELQSAMNRQQFKAPSKRGNAFVSSESEKQRMVRSESAPIMPDISVDAIEPVYDASTPVPSQAAFDSATRQAAEMQMTEPLALYPLPPEDDEDEQPS